MKLIGIFNNVNDVYLSFYFKNKSIQKGIQL